MNQTSFKCTNCNHSVGMDNGTLKHRIGTNNGESSLECSCGCNTPHHPRWCK